MAPWADGLFAMDAAWWRIYIDEVKAVFHGLLLTSAAHCYGAMQVGTDEFPNSGAGAIATAAKFGAKRVILLGYDCQLTDSKTHWHGNHPKGLGDAGSVAEWPAHFERLAKKLDGIDVVNCSRETALTCFARGDLDAELERDKTPLLVKGMHGMGDNLHQRAVIRELVHEHDVWLETPWPCFYQDLNIHLLRPDTRLRTQAKNAAREAGRFDSEAAPAHAQVLRVSYPPERVRRCGSVLAAMAEQCGVPVGDFRLPVPNDWLARADALIASWHTDKPILVYRPLVERTEWSGCTARNPDRNAYKAILDAIRDHFFVVSVADLQKNVEWMTSHPIDADIEYHAGELDVEILSGLFRRAALIYTAPGFAVVLAQAIGTAVVAVFGGYEDSSSFSSGARFAPYLGIDPIHPVRDFRHNDRVEKTIDVAAAIDRIQGFVNENCPQSAISTG